MTASRRACWLSILLTVCTLFLGQTCGGLASTNAEHQERPVLAQMCKRSGGKVPKFTSLSQMLQVISPDQEQQLEKDCRAKYGPAIRELRALLTSNLLRDICSIQMYEMIRTYHVRFIHYYLPEMTRKQLLDKQRLYKRAGTEPIMAQLRDFFILFVKQINASCKQHLVERFKAMKDLHEEVSPSEEDFSVLQRFKMGSQKLSRELRWLPKLGLLASDNMEDDNFKDLQILDSIDLNHNESSLDKGPKLYLQVKFDDPLISVKTACKRRFMPVYLELFAPVIRLNNLGYIERTRSRLEDRELNQDESILRWQDIIQICEMFKDIEVLHDSTAMSAIVDIINDNSHLSTGGDTGQPASQPNRVKILSPEEASQLRKRFQYDDEIQPAYDPEPLHPSHEPVVFAVRMWLSERGEINNELNFFRKDLNQFVWERTSMLLRWRKNVLAYFRPSFFKHEDQSAISGLQEFIEAHRLPITLISIVIGLIVSPIVLGG